jgi:hypothetical protein
MKKATPLLLLALFSFSCSSSSSLRLLNKFEAEEGQMLQSEYDFNSTFLIPPLTKDGITYSATIEFPSGATYSLSEVTLSEYGVYKIHYSAEKDGTFYNELATFLVRCPYYSFSGPSSYAKYETSDRTYGKEGLFVSLAEGETMTFNCPLNVSESSEIFSGFVAPTNVGSIDFSELYFALTDKGEQNNVLTVKAQASTGGISQPISYWSGKANDQPFVGYEQQFNNIHTNNEFGCDVAHSFYGYYLGQDWSKECKIGEQTLNFTYNPSDKTLKTNGKLISDLDDSTYYPSLWDGFVGSEATLSIYAKGYSNASANFVIFSISGLDLKQTCIVDKEAPTISVDAPKSIPSAKKGMTYPVFEAKAVDKQDGECDVSVHAYSGYGTESAVALPIKDGRFETKYNGDYALVYESSDKSGNIAQKVITISTSTSLEELTLSPKEEPATSSKVGVRYAFPDLQTKGGSGSKSVNFEVSKGDALISSSESSFIPEELGEYKIKATASDILGNKATYEYSLMVKENEDPIVYDDLTLPKYLVSGGLYTLPDLACYDYSSGAKETKKMDVKIEGGVFDLEAKGGDVFVPSVDGGQKELTFTYSYKNLKVVKKVLAINPNVFSNGYERFRIENYLDNKNASIDVEPEYLALTASSDDDLSSSFVNPLLAEGLSLKLRTLPDQGEIKKLNVIFEDSENANETITLNLITNSSDGNIYYGLDTRLYATKSNFTDTDDLKRDLSFDYSDGTFTFNEVGAKAKYYDDGKPFNGFSSGKVYVSLCLPEAKKGTGIAWKLIDNQSISYVSSDYNSPRLSIVGDYGGSYSIGAKGKINKALASDVLDPSVNLTVSVKAPSGKPALDEHGSKLSNVSANREYTVDLSEYGQYIVTYRASDNNGESTSLNYALNVMDEIDPVINVLEEPPAEINLGEAIRIPAYETSDNTGKEVTVSVFILTPNGQSICLNEAYNAFTPSYKGDYILRLRAFDSSGNVTYLSYTIKVK